MLGYRAQLYDILKIKIEVNLLLMFIDYFTGVGLCFAMYAGTGGFERIVGSH